MAEVAEEHGLEVKMDLGSDSLDVARTQTSVAEEVRIKVLWARTSSPTRLCRVGRPLGTLGETATKY